MMFADIAHIRRLEATLDEVSDGCEEFPEDCLQRLRDRVEYVEYLQDAISNWSGAHNSDA